MDGLGLIRKAKRRVLEYTGKQFGPARQFLEDALVAETDECILWPFASWDGRYGDMGYEGRAYRVHKLVCLLKYGPCPPGMEACHGCNNGLCINYRHLRYDTRAGNMEDMNKAKRGRSRLDEDYVHWIRRQALLGFSAAEIAEILKINKAIVSGVVTGRTWKWVPVQDPYVKKWKDMNE